MCRPWSEGGLDIKPTRLINEALILKLAWDLMAKDSQWSILFKRHFFSNGKPITHYFESSIWLGIKEQIGTVLGNSLWMVGTEEKIPFRTDNWLGEPLVNLLHLDSDFHGHLHGKVSVVIVNGSWELPAAIIEYGDIQDRLESLVLPTIQLPDVLVWPHASDGILSLKHALAFLRERSPLLPWADHI